MSSVLAFVKAMIEKLEPVILKGFDQNAIPELQSLAAQAKSPDVQVLLNAAVAALKAVGDAEIPKV